jgi:glycosyltransferase involved in cell wall biosynthesis
VITGLGRGGAEMMLAKLLTRLPGLRVQSRVLSLEPGGDLARDIRALGVEVTEVDLRGRGLLRGLLDVRRWIAAQPTDVVQTWMYHGDLIGGAAARAAGVRGVVWDIQAGWFDPESTKPATRWVIKLCSWSSRLIPARIVCCGRRTLEVHREAGYAADRLEVIPNSADLSAFVPDPTARPAVLGELSLPPTARLVGLVARFHPHKDHRTFVAAAGRVAARHPDVHFVLCGTGVSRENEELAGWVGATGHGGRFHLLGPRQDVARLVAAMDVACLTSIGEGLPNVLLEAMACAVPCVTTDVGDAAWVVGETGAVSPVGDPVAFGDALDRVLSLPPAEHAALGRAARARVERHFNLDVAAAAYADTYRTVAARTAR